MSTQPLSPLEQLGAMGQAQTPSQPQPPSNLSPLEQLAAMKPAQQTAPSTDATPFVPNARIRNLPNPAEGMEPGEALSNGMKTGAELAAVPASAIGLSEAAPVIQHLAESLPTLDKAYKVLKTVSGVTSGTGGALYTLQHLKDVLKIIGGSSK